MRRTVALSGERARSTREAVLLAVRRKPGASIRDVARVVGIDATTADYHLRRLWRENRVLRERSGRVVAHYLNGSCLTPRDRALLALTPPGRVVLAALAKKGRPMRAVDLARETGHPVGQVRYALHRAVGLGLARQPWLGKFEVVAHG